MALIVISDPVRVLEKIRHHSSCGPLKKLYLLTSTKLITDSFPPWELLAMKVVIWGLQDFQWKCIRLLTFFVITALFLNDIKSICIWSGSQWLTQYCRLYFALNVFFSSSGRRNLQFNLVICCNYFSMLLQHYRFCYWHAHLWVWHG